MNSVSAIARIAGTAFLFGILSSAQGATPSTWDGANSNWSNASHWTTKPFFPNNGNGSPNYDANINSGIVNLDVDVDLSSLSIKGGTLSGSGAITADALTLSGGTLSTTGAVASGHINLIGGILNRDLTLSSGSHTIENVNVAAGRTLINDVGSILTAPTGPGEREAFGAGTFINKGTFVKTGNLRAYMSISTVNNEGVVQVQQNNLRFTQKGDHTGTFEISAGGQLEFAGTQNFASTATISGVGNLVILGGTSTIDSNVDVGLFRLLTGTLKGSGILNAANFSLEGGILDRDLTLSTGSHTIENVNVAAGRTLINDVGSILTAPTGPGEREAFGAGTFINKGTFVKTGNLRAYMSISTVNNEGVVQVQQNNLRFTQTGDHSGTFEVSAGAQLEFSGNQKLSSTATISGAGNFAILGGTSTIDSDVSVNQFRLMTGTLKGTGHLSATSFWLEGGTLDRDLTLSTGTHTIENVQVAAGRTLVNDVDSILTAPAGPGERQAFGAGTFINKGTFIKTGTARSYMSVSTANNEGDVQVQQSALRFDRTGTHTGSFEISAGAQLEFAGVQTLTSSSSITGPGLMLIVDGNVAVNTVISPGTIRVIGGTLSGGGTIEAPTAIETLTSAVAPGNGVGTLTFDAGLSFSDGSRVIWELGALSTSNPGVDWDQIIIAGGDLVLAGATYLDVHLLGADFNPITGNPFWSTTQRWEKIINLTDDASSIDGTPQFLIDNGSWSRAGSFSVEASIDGRGLDLVWTAVPEPSSMILSGVAVIACITYAARSNLRKSEDNATRVS